MAFKAFPSDSQGDNQSLPWFEDFVKSDSQSIGKTIDVRSVRLTPKGMMILTDNAKGFIYQSHPAYRHVLEFIQAWSGKRQPSPILQVMVIGIRPFINLGVNEDRRGVWSVETDGHWSQAYYTTSDNPDKLADTNPFPLPSSGDRVLSDTLSEDGIVMQTSQEMPLEASGSPLNSVKRKKTPKQT